MGADSTGPTSSNNIISGVRSSSDIVLKVDGPKAAQGGITFFLNSNGVILTRGKDGVLPSKYITGVIVCANRAVVQSANSSFGTQCPAQCQPRRSCEIYDSCLPALPDTMHYLPLWRLADMPLHAVSPHRLKHHAHPRSQQLSAPSHFCTLLILICSACICAWGCRRPSCRAPHLLVHAPSPAWLTSPPTIPNTGNLPAH